MIKWLLNHMIFTVLNKGQVRRTTKTVDDKNDFYRKLRTTMRWTTKI